MNSVLPTTPRLRVLGKGQNWLMVAHQLASAYGIRRNRAPAVSSFISIPESAVFPVSASDEEFARGLCLAAAIFWYDKGLISQDKGAEIAGLTRVEFIDALGQANVSAPQTSVEELKAEKEQAINARR